MVRVGLTDWVKRAGADREVAQITRNIVDVLRRVKPRVRSGPVEDPALHHPQPQAGDVEVGVTGNVSAARVDAAVWSCS